MKVRLLLSASLLLAVLSFTASAQELGGRYAHGWLQQAPSAATSGLAGWSIRLDGRDPAIAQWNPALLNANTADVIHVSQDFYPTGSGRSIVSYGRQLGKRKLDVSANLQYAGFGEFEGRTEAGIATGTFSAREYAIGVSAAHQLADRVRVGANLQVAGGNIDSYSSLGAAVSAGLTYQPDSAGLTVWGVQMRHAGYMFDGYTEQQDPLPFSMSVGVSRRLKYLPLRFGVLYRRLDQWNILYDDPDRRESDGFLSSEPIERGAASLWVDNFSRHLAFNAELYLGKKEVIQLRAGYDHQRQREMKVSEFRSLAGFSFGFGVNLRKFRFDYGRTVQHIAGGTNHIGFLIDLNPGARPSKV
ncbi:MAG: type IX secretion system protein PorQ [Saprospiraceae bacterium]